MAFAAIAPELAIASLAATAIGGGISAYGAYQSGQAQKAYYNYQAGVQQQLAQVARLKANRDIMAGEQEAQKYGIQTSQQVGGIRARAAAGGIGVDTGSTAEVQASQLAVGGEEQKSARQTAAERAYGENVEAAAKTASAGAMEFAGSQAATAGDISAFGDVVGTAGKMASLGLDYSKYSSVAGGGSSSVAPKWYPDSSSDPTQIGSYY